MKSKQNESDFNTWNDDIIKNMKIIRELEINADDFFQELFTQIVEDMQKNGNKAYKIGDIKQGFKTSFVSQGHKSVYEVLELQNKHAYKARLSSINGTTTVSYLIEEKEKGISVTFEQLSSAVQEKKKGFFGAFSNTLYLGRMSDHLYNIQKAVLNKKEGFEPVEFSILTPKRKKK